jgi:hypothetical protein
MRKRLDDWAFWRRLAQRSFVEFREKQKICCFASSGIDVLFWSHYASSHASFCYRFDCADSELGVARSKVARIKYVKQRPQLSLVDILTHVAASTYPDKIKIDDDEIERYTDAVVATKSDLWAHEGEWRALRGLEEKTGYHSIKPYYLKEVIFGCRANRLLKNFVRDKLNGSVVCTETEMDNTTYTLRYRQ